MGIKVRISGPLRRFCEGKAEIEVVADNVSDCLRGLEIRYPGLKEQLWNEQSQLNRFINVYVNGQDVRLLQELATHLKVGDEVYVLPAMAGG